MGKVSKKKSRRDNRGSRRSNNDLEQSARKPTGESSSMILTEMTSMDLKKRLSAIIMYKDLLMQNLNNLTVITKLTTVEILSSLSLRLIDSVSGVRSEAVKCFLAVARCGTKFAEKIFFIRIENIRSKQVFVQHHRNQVRQFLHSLEECGGILQRGQECHRVQFDRSRI